MNATDGEDIERTICMDLEIQNDKGRGIIEFGARNKFTLTKTYVKHHKSK